MKKIYFKPKMAMVEVESEPILALSMEEGIGDGGGPYVRMRGTHTEYAEDIFDVEEW